MCLQQLVLAKVSQMLDDVLTSRQKEDLPALGDVGDDLGTKRLAKLNTILKKSPPLKPWTMRGKKDNAVCGLIWQLQRYGQSISSSLSHHRLAWR